MQLIFLKKRLASKIKLLFERQVRIAKRTGLVWGVNRTKARLYILLLLTAGKGSLKVHHMQPKKGGGGR